MGIGRLLQAPEIFGALLDTGPLLRHAGPTALPRLLALMTPHLGDYGIGENYSAALSDRRTRLPVNDSTRDGETMLDERLLAAAINARRAILAESHVAGAETP
ncbi:hypothetical protein [Streptomyces sp. NRRL S-241]|uniref:hypothetical protein n=1 Tax=Streptomyces sp. NRRL S-241 TaxID=1463896 RepID=UPI0004BF866D|nr:hypothetical protein [Streptomyces sp. NRRL S-241]